MDEEMTSTQLMKYIDHFRDWPIEYWPRPSTKLVESQLSTFDTTIPVVEVERYSDRQVRFWCEYCDKFHYHGYHAGDWGNLGHVGEHCFSPSLAEFERRPLSPYVPRGYYLYLPRQVSEGRRPERFQRIRMTVMARDREYFAQHPGEYRYRRLYVPGEFWPGELDADTMVTVMNGYRDMRFREAGGWMAIDRDGASR